MTMAMGYRTSRRERGTILRNLLNRFGRRAAVRQSSFSLADLDHAIQEHEAQKGLTSQAFLAKWDAGEIDHGDFDFSRWALLLRARDRAAT